MSTKEKQHGEVQEQVAESNKMFLLGSLRWTQTGAETLKITYLRLFGSYRTIPIRPKMWKVLR
jgi:hypothetical protein